MNRTDQSDQMGQTDEPRSGSRCDPRDELAAFILARVADDLGVLGGAGAMPAQVGERLLAECEVKRRLVAHVQSIDWAYEPAGDQDYMRTVLEPLALLWAAHPVIDPYWVI